MIDRIWECRHLHHCHRSEVARAYFTKERTEDESGVGGGIPSGLKVTAQCGRVVERHNVLQRAGLALSSNQLWAAVSVP